MLSIAAAFLLASRLAPLEGDPGEDRTAGTSDTTEGPEPNREPLAPPKRCEPSLRDVLS
jgi:hypothetical protein